MQSLPGAGTPGDRFFCFQFGEAAEWLDRTVNVPTLSSLSLDEWLAEFERLKKLNADILKTPKKPASQRKQPKRGADSSRGNP